VAELGAGGNGEPDMQDVLAVAVRSGIELLAPIPDDSPWEDARTSVS
jgi:hypothetical protein